MSRCTEDRLPLKRKQHTERERERGTGVAGRNYEMCLDVLEICVLSFQLSECGVGECLRTCTQLVVGSGEALSVKCQFCLQEKKIHILAG